MRSNETRSNGALDDLISVLKAERALLLNGEVGAMSAIAARKDKIMAAIPGMQASEADAHLLLKIRDMAEHNARLLQAALDGIRAVSVRMKALREAGSKFETYDSHGQRSDLLSKGSLEKRA